jgi:hypothetical protein
MTDIHIIIKPNRLWVSIHANTDDGKDWIKRHVGDRESDAAAAAFPVAFVTEYVLLITSDKLVVRVMSA